MDKKAFKSLDQEEKDLMESIERDEWQPVRDFLESSQALLTEEKNGYYFNRSCHLFFIAVETFALGCSNKYSDFSLHSFFNDISLLLRTSRISISLMGLRRSTY
ncbi:MAG: hypothetical protein LC657_03870, partial [Desulfobacteraceae bacterium]|nr:hypothetical protein [Desulfobacteraceae bacterium]